MPSSNELLRWHLNQAEELQGKLRGALTNKRREEVAQRIQDNAQQIERYQRQEIKDVHPLSSTGPKD